MPFRNRGGKKITLLADVSNRDESEKVLSAGAEGIGLFRVENIYMSGDRVPDLGGLIPWSYHKEANGIYFVHSGERRNR